MVSGQRLPYNVYGGDREGACERIILADKIMWGLGLAASCSVLQDIMSEREWL